MSKSGASLRIKECYFPWIKVLERFPLMHVGLCTTLDRALGFDRLAISSFEKVDLAILILYCFLQPSCFHQFVVLLVSV